MDRWFKYNQIFSSPSMLAQQAIYFVNVFYLARLAKLPTGLYILLALISFFFYLFNDFLETNYLKIRWTDFHNLFTK